MTPERFLKARSLFEEALGLEFVQRDKFLTAACGADDVLRAEVESLLEENKKNGLLQQNLAIDALNSLELEIAFENLEFEREKENDTMQQIRCNGPLGHMYDPAKHSSCPYCPMAIPGFDVKTESAATPPPPPPPIWGRPKDPPPDFRPDEKTQRRKTPDDDQPTVGPLVIDGKAGRSVDPVVGWLVCVDGVNSGRDYRVKSQRNFIGRDPSMDISIAGDDEVSRKQHAVISYDPRGNVFRISPGEARGLTYLNGESVEVPTILKPYDLIEVGKTHLRFVPFCGDQFKWQ
jgi:hypothetical protein